MALTKVGQVSIPSGSTNVDITGLGFQPTGVILWQMDTTNATALIGQFGASDGTNHIAWSQTSTSRTASYRSGSNSLALYRVSQGGGDQLRATVAMLSDGFRIACSLSNTNVNIGYMAFNGVSFKVGSFAPSSTGNGSVTSIGFQPSAMLFAWLPSVANSASYAFGMVDSALNQFGAGGNNNSGSASYYLYSGSKALQIPTSSGVANSGTITALNSNGFSYNLDTYDSTQTFGYVALGGIQAKLINALFTAGTGAQSFTGAGFRPQSLISHYIEPNSNVWGIARGFGAADDVLSQSGSATAGFRGATGVTNRGSSTVSALVRTTLGGSASVLYTDASVTSYDNDGFTINRTSDSNGDNFMTLLLASTPTAKTLDQTGNARIEKPISLDQTGNARIQATYIAAQTGNARIEKPVSLTQQGNARIQRTEKLDQTANARIQRTETAVQQGNARLEVTSTINQSGNATLESYFVAVSIDQTANARIQRLYTLDQPGNARIARIESIDQSGNAHIERIESITQTGNATLYRIDSLDQIGNATIEKNKTITQVGNATIVQQNTLQQIGNARIERIRTITQLGAAIIIRVDQLTQVGNARIRRVESIAIVGSAVITNPTPDKRPQQWEDASTEQPTEWQSQDRAEQIWDQTADKPETPWQNSQETQEQQWSDGDNKQPAEWRRQFYD